MNTAQLYTNELTEEIGNDLSKKVKSYFKNNDFHELQENSEILSNVNHTVYHKNGTTVIYSEEFNYIFTSSGLDLSKKQDVEVKKIAIEFYSDTVPQSKVSNFANEVKELSDLFQFELYINKEIIQKL